MTVILIIDDDRALSERLERAMNHAPNLAARALTVKIAQSGAEALRLLDSARPDLILCDIDTPGMDGFMLLTEIRKRESGKQLPLFVTSAVYRRDRAVAARIHIEFAGVFFGKPYPIPDVVAAVEKVLGLNQREASRTGATAPIVRGSPISEAPEIGATPPEGDLSGTPLPRLLLDLHEARASGLLVIDRARIEKRIELAGGNLIDIESSQREETLGNYLVYKRLITEDQHQSALRRAAERGTLLGQALVEVGALNAAQLVRCLGALTRHKLITALRWGNGTYAFRRDADLPERAVGESIYLPSLVFRGLRETANVGDAAAFCQRIGALRLRLTARGKKMKGSFAEAFGDALFAALEDRPAVDSLVSGRFDIAVALPAVEASILTGCAETYAAGAHVSVPPMKVSSPAPLDPIALERLSLSEVVIEDPDPASEFGGQPTAKDSGVIDVGSLWGSSALTGDSGLIDIRSLWTPPTSTPPAGAAGDLARAKEEVLSEFLRIQGKDWYDVLGLDRRASTEDIDRAFAEKGRAFSRERFSHVELGREYAKLKEILASYERARETLRIPKLREAYDRQLDRTGVPPTQDAFRAELLFREAQRRSEMGNADDAVQLYQNAVNLLPQEADYHAALGWALFQRSERTRSDADRNLATEQLDRALEIDPEHATALEYLGRMLASRADDHDRAIPLLLRALDAPEPRLGALAELELIFERRGDWSALEHTYRKILGRIGDKDRATAARLWTKAGALYQERLGSVERARIAYQCAARLMPQDPAILRALSQTMPAAQGGFDARAEALRVEWRQDRSSPRPLADLVRLAFDESRPDAAFVAAAVMVARGIADAEAQSTYARYRPRFLLRAQRGLDVELLRRIRHADDNGDLATLLGLVEPALERIAPTAADARIEQIPEASLPEPFVRARTYVAGMLGLAAPCAVGTRADLQHEITIGFTPRPVLLAGRAALASEDRVDLAFRLGRAMSYLAPGRWMALAQPARLLRVGFLAAVKLTSPSSQLEDPDGKVEATRQILAQAPPEVLSRVQSVVTALIKGKSKVNLKRWADGLARSSNRIGLVMANDPVIAAAAAAAPEVEDLLDFALGPDHLWVRSALGTSIDV